jgi:uncharacterized protein (TIGR02231 family)
MPAMKTAVSSVTVFPDRARVARLGTASLQKGIHVLEIEDLPAGLNPESMRASARGTVQARLFGVQMKRSYFSETPAQKVRELENALEAAQDEIHRLDARIDISRKNLAYLEALSGQSATFATALAAGEMKLDEHLALLDGLRKRMESLADEQVSLGVEKRQLESEIQKLKNELNQQRSSRPRQRFTAQVEVELVEPGELRLELVYVGNQAHWKPLYDLRLHEQDGQPELEVTYLAQVVQSTGEDWDRASLTLSTARPALASQLPELDPWYIEPFQPVVRSRRAPAALMAAAETPDIEPQQISDKALYEAEPVYAVQEEAGAAVTYHVAGHLTIPSDGEPHKTTIASFNLPARLDYVAAPRLVEAAYRRARVVNSSPHILLAGQLNMFAGDEFLGTTSLELTPPKGEMELYLGSDDRLKVERKLKRRDIDKSLVGGKRRLHYGYEVVLENLLPVEAQVSLHDQFPVSRHEDIKVKLDSTDPRPQEQTELNLLRWDIKLEPGEKRVARYDFSIEHPQAMTVVGLP